MKNLKILTVLILVATIGSFSACSSGGLSNTPGDTITKSYNFLKNKDYEKVSKMYLTRDGKEFSEAEEKKMVSLAAMAYEQHQKKDGLKNIEITEKTISEDGNSAKVKFIIHFNNGDTDNENADLLKKDGKWFIKI